MTETKLELWQRCFRDGFAPSLSTPGLEALTKALRDDSPRLVQGKTTIPPPLHCVEDWPVQAACAIGFCCVIDYGGFAIKGSTAVTCQGATVGETEEGFAQACMECDQRLGEPAAARWFLNWADKTPRKEMRRELLVEVERELERRTSLVF